MINWHIDTCDKVFMAQICDTSTPVQLSSIFLYGVFGDGIHYLQQPETILSMGMWNSAPVPHLDEDGGTTGGTLITAVFYKLKYVFHQ